MENNFARVVATIAIWGAVAIVLGIVTGSLTGVTLLIFGVFLAMAAGASTMSIWNGGREASSHSVETAAEKSKRVGSMRVSRIVDSLSDEELDQLRARLEEREETVPLESLMSRRQKQ